MAKVGLAKVGFDRFGLLLKETQTNVKEESVLRPPTRALPSVIVDTARVLREADGPFESDSTKSLLRVERCSPRHAPRNLAEAGAEPEKTQAASLRMDGIPALDLWDLIVTVLHGNTNHSKLVR